MKPLDERMRDWDWVHKSVNFSIVDGWADEVEELKAEVERLQKDLQECKGNFLIELLEAAGVGVRSKCETKDHLAGGE